MAETFKLKAVKNAPEQIAHGNFLAELKKGFYEVADRRFADHIIAAGHGVETESKMSQESEGEIE